MPELFQYGQAATVYFTMVKAGGTLFASGPDWTPGGSNAIVTRNGTLVGFAAGTVTYLGSSIWALPFGSAELQSKQTTVTIREPGTVDDQSVMVHTYGNALAQHPNIGLTTFGSVGTVEHIIAGTIDLVDLVAAGTIDLTAVAAAVQTGTIDLVAQLAAGTVDLVSAGTIDLVSSGTVDLVNSVAAGTVDLVAQLAAGTVGLVNSGSIDVVSSGTIDLVAAVAAVESGTIDLVVQLAAGTVGLVSAGTIDLVAQLAAGTVGLVSAGTIDLVAQLAAGTIDLVKAGTVDKVTLVSSGTIDLANTFAAAAITSIWNAGTKQQFQMRIFTAYSVTSDRFSIAAWLERDDVPVDVTSATFALYTQEGSVAYGATTWDTGPTEVTALNSWYAEKDVATEIKGGTAYVIKAEMIYDGTTFTRLYGFGAFGTGTA